MKTKFHSLLAPFLLFSELNAQIDSSGCLTATARCSFSESVLNAECGNLPEVLAVCFNGECEAEKEDECNHFTETLNIIAETKGCNANDFIDDCAVLKEEISCSARTDFCLGNSFSGKTCDEAVLDAIDCSYSICRDDKDFCGDFSSSIASSFKENSRECDISITQCEDLMSGDDTSANYPDEIICSAFLHAALHSTAGLPCDEIPLAFAEIVEGSCDTDDAKQCSGFVSSLNHILNFNQCGEEALVEDCSLIQNDDNNVTTPDCASTMDFCADYSFLFEDFPKECSEFESAMFLCLGKTCEQQSGVCSAFPDIIEFLGSWQELSCFITDEKCSDKFGNPPVNDCDAAIATCMKELEEVPCSDVSAEVGKCAADACNADNDDHCTSLRLHLNALVGIKGCFNAHITEDDCAELFNGAV